MSVLTTVRKLFPQVKQVKDATKPVLVTVAKEDSVTGRKKDAANCALAKACVRTKIAEGAIIGLTTTYLIHGTTATRYKNAQTVSREIMSFDRHQDFAAGRNYRLCAIPPATKIGVPHVSHSNKRPRKDKLVRKTHRTAFVRKLKDQ